MTCPFCHCANAATARACRVCGGPLRKTSAPPNVAIAPKMAAFPVAPILAPMPTLSARQTFDPKSAPLVNAGFLPDENASIWLVRADGVVQSWNADNDEISAFSIGRFLRKSSPVCCAVLACNFIATGHENGEVRLHNLHGKEIGKPSSHVGPVLALAATSAHLYSGGSDGVVWQTPLPAANSRGKSAAYLEGLGAMTTLAIAPDEKSLAVGCDEGAVQLWRLNEDEETPTPRLDWSRSGHATPIQSVLFSPNGNMILSRDAEGELCLWAAQTSYQLPLPLGAHSSHAAPVFSSDSRLLAIANAENGVDIFEVATEKTIYSVSPPNEKTQTLAFSSDGKSLLLAGTREIAIWKMT